MLDAAAHTFNPSPPMARGKAETELPRSSLATEPKYARCTLWQKQQKSCLKMGWKKRTDFQRYSLFPKHVL